MGISKTGLAKSKVLRGTKTNVLQYLDKRPYKASFIVNLVGEERANLSAVVYL